MNFRAIAMLALLVFSLPAASQLRTVVDAVEASSSNVTVPTSPNGRLLVKPCSDQCDADPIAARLTALTEFVLQGKVVEFAEFRAGFYDSRPSNDGYTLVSIDTRENTVTRIELAF